MMTLDSLRALGPVLFDGSCGTELQRRGLPAGTPPCTWNLTNPNIVLQLHRDYVEAGAQVIETNTFGASERQLAAGEWKGKFSEVNRRGVELARKATEGRAVVAGSVGPLGTLLEPYGDLGEAEAMELYAQQFTSLREGGIDLLLIETMISLKEALIALGIAKKTITITTGVTMTFEVGANGARTPFGESPAEVAAALAGAGADFIGSNCGTGFEDMLVVAQTLRDSTQLPLLIQPNAGVPELEGDKIVYPGTPKLFGEFIKKVRAIGVEYVGGCCGTRPDHIRVAKSLITGFSA